MRDFRQAKCSNRTELVNNVIVFLGPDDIWWLLTLIPLYLHFRSLKYEGIQL